MQYSIGNWTVSSQYNDTLTETKSISIPDLSYSADYAKKEDEPTRAVVTNTTGSNIGTVETLRFGCVPVNDVYASTGIAAEATAPSKRGVQLLVEANTVYSAVNSTTGQEVLLPCRGRLTLQVPSTSFVNGDLLQDVLLRTVSACFSTNGTGSNRLVELAKGSLIPE